MNPMLRSRSPAASTAEQPAESSPRNQRATHQALVVAVAVARLVRRRQHRHRGVYDLEAIRDVVRGRVARPQLHPQRLPVRHRAHHRTEPVAALEMGSGARLVLRVHLHQSRVHIDNQRPAAVAARPQVLAHPNRGAQQPRRPPAPRPVTTRYSVESDATSPNNSGCARRYSTSEQASPPAASTNSARTSTRPRSCKGARSPRRGTAPDKAPVNPTRSAKPPKQNRPTPQTTGSPPPDQTSFGNTANLHPGDPPLNPTTR